MDKIKKIQNESYLKEIKFIIKLKIDQKYKFVLIKNVIDKWKE